MIPTALRAVAALGIVIAVAMPSGRSWADGIRDDQWYLGFLNVLEAHGQSRGENVVVAVVDSGVDATHPDLRANVLTGTDLVPGGSGDGRQDAKGHGTGMASLIAGHGHSDASGVLGIAPGVKILPVRVETATRVGDTNDAARGVEWAVDRGAAVVCIASTGGVSTELLNAVRRAQRSNVVVVAAAGNRPENTGVGAPASFPGVIAAAAVNRDGEHDPISVTGPEIVLAAPGVDIVSAGRNGGYRDGTGTSDATAIIAGAAALVRAKYPDLPASEVVRRLTATATDKGPPGRDQQYGYGVLNLVAALTANVPPQEQTTATAPTTAPTTATAAPEPGSGPNLLPIMLLTAAIAGTAAGATLWRLRRQR